MILLIDIGNTNTVCAIYNGQKYITYERIKSKNDINQKLKQFSNYTIKKVAISSVVPEWTEHFIKIIEQVTMFLLLI